MTDTLSSKDKEEMHCHMLLMLKRRELSVTIDGITYTGDEAVKLPVSKLFSEGARYSVTEKGIRKYKECI